MVDPNDYSNKPNYTFSNGDFKLMINAVNNFKGIPLKVYIRLNGVKQTSYISYKVYDALKHSWDNYNKNTQSEPPQMTMNIIQLGPIQKAVQNILGTFNTFTEFYNKCKGRGYSYYYNDIKTLEQESNTIANLNCVDSTQLGVHLAREMGYEAHHHRVKCTQSQKGHVYGSIKGKEFSNSTKFDMAACLSVGSQYPIGRTWCGDARILATDEGMWESDDGRT